MSKRLLIPIPTLTGELIEDVVDEVKDKQIDRLQKIFEEEDNV